MIERGKRAKLNIFDDAMGAGIKSEFDDYTVEIYNPKPEELIVWKYNTNTLGFEQVNNMYKFIQSSFPNNVVVAIPDDTILELINKDDMIKILKDFIKDLEEVK